MSALHGDAGDRGPLETDDLCRKRLAQAGNAGTMVSVGGSLAAAGQDSRRPASIVFQSVRRGRTALLTRFNQIEAVGL